MKIEDEWRCRTKNWIARIGAQCRQKWLAVNITLPEKTQRANQGKIGIKRIKVKQVSEGLKRDDSIAIGKHFDQDAIVWVCENAVPELILLH